MPHVVLRDLTKNFGDARAVDGLNLEIAKGSFTTLLGPSGCGKTTTLRILAGFYEPDRGDVLIDGKSQRGLPPFKRNISIVFQDYALFPHMNVFDNLGYGLKLRRVRGPERRRRVEKVLDFLGLTRFAKRFPHELSGGQQQRVALGRSIVMEPDVLLMDEPLSNLDAKLRIRVRTELKEIQRVLGLTTIYVTHDQDEALSMSDQVAVMAEGRLQQYSPPWALYNEPVNPFVADFVGHTNFIPVRTLQSGGEQPRVAVLGQEMVCSTRAGSAVGAAENVMLMVRPEWFEVATSEQERREWNASEGVILEGTVTASDYLGSHNRVWLDVEGIADELAVDLPAKAIDSAEAGRKISVKIPNGRGILFGS
ncbi:MAG: ABC transporter ATP-binding protein [Trueperaceae bacterium]